MNLAAALRFVARFPAIPGTGGAARSSPPPRRRARTTLAWFVLAMLVLHFGFYFAIDASGSHLRDPEYGIPAFDGRHWVPDELVLDGHHLAGLGADAFTSRIVKEAVVPWMKRSRAKP